MRRRVFPALFSPRSRNELRRCGGFKVASGAVTPDAKPKWSVIPMSGETVRIDDEGPAFPRTKTILNHDIEMQENYPDTYSVGGMSLRDYFAGQVLAGDMADGTSGYYDSEAAIDVLTARAKMYYRFADAMLAARKAGGK